MTALLRLGGFGLGSNLSWSTTLEVRYRFSKTFGILLGYSLLSIDTDIGSGANEFVLDLKLRGPEPGS